MAGQKKLKILEETILYEKKDREKRGEKKRLEDFLKCIK